MWSIEYVVQEAEEQEKCTSATSDHDSTTTLQVDKKNLHLQESEETKSESDIKSERSEESEPVKPEDAIKRVEELVKQMSLSKENEGKIY